MQQNEETQKAYLDVEDAFAAAQKKMLADMTAALHDKLKWDGILLSKENRFEIAGCLQRPKLISTSYEKQEDARCEIAFDVSLKLNRPTASLPRHFNGSAHGEGQTTDAAWLQALHSILTDYLYPAALNTALAVPEPVIPKWIPPETFASVENSTRIQIGQRLYPVQIRSKVDNSIFILVTPANHKPFYMQEMEITIHQWKNFLDRRAETLFWSEARWNNGIKRRPDPNEDPLQWYIATVSQTMDTLDVWEGLLATKINDWENTYPVCFVRPKDAEAYADWISGGKSNRSLVRLPTVTEWRTAADNNTGAPKKMYLEKLWPEAPERLKSAGIDISWCGIIGLRSNVRELTLQDGDAHPSHIQYRISGAFWSLSPEEDEARIDYYEDITKSRALYNTGFRLIMMPTKIQGQ